MSNIEQKLVDETRVFLGEVCEVIDLIEDYWYMIADDMSDRDIGWYRPSFEYFINELPRLCKLVSKCKTEKGHLEIMTDYHDRMPPRYTYTTKEGKILPYKGETS